jgi:radical SAM superfamily enzyme YgiQ (UPF0313 family)
MKVKKKVILFNPRSANSKHRIPNSILQVGASIHGIFDYVFVDGNMEKDPWNVIHDYLKTGQYGYFGTTVMPGPQLKQAIPYAKRVKSQFPEVTNIWGGYFAANQCDVVLESEYVDFVINGPGDYAFPALLQALEDDKPYELLPNLIFRAFDGKIISTRKDQLHDQNKLPPLPYYYLDTFYPVEKYLAKTFLGNKTLAYHSSVGCPFKCSFCAVVPIYEARWKGKNAENIYNDVIKIKEKYGADSIEFHDNNFFVSEKRVQKFAKLMLNEKMSWWGEARIDTVDRFSDETLFLMKESGCKMIFFGAETGNDTVLKQMDKGGTQSGEQILNFARRLKQFNIIPEYSFVLGMPADTAEEVHKQIEEEILFIKKVKDINPSTEIIIYVYSPVPTKGSELYRQIQDAGFQFPEKLEDWLSPQWLNFDLRKNPLTPWLTSKMVQKIQDFETVLHGYYPTISDSKLTNFQRKAIKYISNFRYSKGMYKFPIEIKLLQKFWLKYRQPEIEGF